MMMEQVTQADEAAAKAMLEHAFRNVGTRALKDVRFADIVEHFAKHRQAERAECIRIVDEFETFSGDPRDDAVRDVMAVDLQEALGAFGDKASAHGEPRRSGVAAMRDAAADVAKRAGMAADTQMSPGAVAASKAAHDIWSGIRSLPLSESRPHVE